MVIGQTQCFLIALLITGVLGARRGWGREVITSAIILGTVLFLANGGGNMVASLLSQTIRSGSSTAASATGSALATSTCNINGNLVSTLLFGGMTWLAYGVGTKYGTAPRTHNHRIAGTIPGAINGAAMAYYLSDFILPGRQVLINSPTPAFSTSFLPEIIGIGLVGLLVIVFVAAQATKK